MQGSSIVTKPNLDNHFLVETVDAIRTATFNQIPEKRRAEMGQFGTPTSVAKLMASMFEMPFPEIRLLDAGAGVGSLTAAFVEEACRREVAPKSISVTAFELDPILAGALRENLERCARHCGDQGIRFSSQVVEQDFIEYVAEAATNLFGTKSLGRFNCAIQNPPYHKIQSNSRHRQLLREVGIETTNLYAAFVALAVRLLEPGSEMVTITPRSFCNGPYFSDFRADFLRRMILRRIHVFDSRSEAFGGDNVLQENVIVHSVASSERPKQVMISSSSGETDADEVQHAVPYDVVVPPGEEAPFIHLITDRNCEAVALRMQRFPHTLDEVGIEISTGRVVDFRATEFLRPMPAEEDAPLIYPVHLRWGKTRWPVEEGKKPNAIQVTKGSQNLLVPAGLYVLVKRFSSKEQRRRVEAALYDSDEVKPGSPVGFENHINYYHESGSGLDRDLAVGLCTYLNSTLLDMYFRLFSGHTQVNATDLRNVPYPSRDDLIRLGRAAGTTTLSQEEVDVVFTRELLELPAETDNPIDTARKIKEAIDVLRQLGLPKAQQNDRSGLALLALLDLKPSTPWSQAKSPMVGITEMMTYFEDHYGKKYAPNTRETVRRQTVHQFLDAALLVQNPDDPSRAVNSAKNVYQVVPEALVTLRTYGTDAWQAAKAAFLSKVPTLQKVYSQVRDMERIPVTVSGGKELLLSPGGQNVLAKKVVEDFLPRFAPGAKLLYVGDTEDKWAYFDKEGFAALGLAFDSHGKFPDIIAHYGDKNWLLLIEAVTSHGPVDAKRHRELNTLFAKSRAGLVFITTFLTRKDLVKYIDAISWETEVWVADSEGHMIHFDGKRFLGPY